MLISLTLSVFRTTCTSHNVNALITQMQSLHRKTPKLCCICWKQIEYLCIKCIFLLNIIPLVFTAYTWTWLHFALENPNIQLSSLASRLPSEIDDCRLLYPGTESIHSVYSGILQEWTGQARMVGFVVRCEPDCCSKFIYIPNRS